MDSHVSLAMEPSSRPPPPPPKTNNKISNSPTFSASSQSNTSPRIRRKPLPATAFSPQSIVSSPTSVFSERNLPTRATSPPSGLALNKILYTPPRRSDSLRHRQTPIEPPPALPSSASLSPQKSLDQTSIPDFPAPPHHDVSYEGIDNENPYKHVTGNANMPLKNTERPPPLRMDSLQAVKALDAKKPQSPGSVFTSFFSRKQTASPQNISPGAESSVTDISDSVSPLPQPGSTDELSYFAQQRPVPSPLQRQESWKSSQSSVSHGALQRMNSGGSGSIGPMSGDLANRCNMLEAELKDISRELAGSIRRELDLEDLVEKLQAEGRHVPMSVDRTSDYFSDSGTSSVRHPAEYNTKEEIDKTKREAEQQRAQLKMDLSQKWQAEISQRKRLESHVQILEYRLSRSRQTTNETSDASARVRELETSLDDARRRLFEERQTKENFEDLLTALRVELEQHRNERDNLRDEVVPYLRSQIEGLESSFGDTQKQAYDFARMQQEIQSLRDENDAISSARKMEQELIRSGMHYIREESSSGATRLSLVVPKPTGLQRASTVSTRSVGPHSRPLSQSISVANKSTLDVQENMTDRLNAVEQQRDALHAAVKYLKSRYYYQATTYEKKIRTLEGRVEKLNKTSDGSRKGGYEREVRTLRQEINTLRRRADDALDQKWQCEKGLAGLKMDLDRSKQETAGLQRLLLARDNNSPELLSTTLEDALADLQQAQAHGQETIASLEFEQHISNQLEESTQRTEALAVQVRQQLDTNSSLRSRLKTAVERGEQNQQTSAVQISNLQSKLRRLEDTLTSTQSQSETAVMKHEEEIQNLKASHNAQLMRAKAGTKSPLSGSAQATPISPMFAVKSPKLDSTSSGPGLSLNQALKAEFLEKKVTELEKALSDAEREMEEVVGRMNAAQIGVFELQQERDEEHNRTRKLESEIKAERERFQTLVNSSMN